jgi:plastocyanin
VTCRLTAVLLRLGQACCVFLIAASPGFVHAAILQLVIENMAFSNVTASAQVGDVVEWSNRDIVPHTVTARDGSFDIVVLPGKTGSIALQKVGTVAFYCRYHPSMTGVIGIRSRS